MRNQITNAEIVYFLVVAAISFPCFLAGIGVISGDVLVVVFAYTLLAIVALLVLLGVCIAALVVPCAMIWYAFSFGDWLKSTRPVRLLYKFYRALREWWTEVIILWKDTMTFGLLDFPDSSIRSGIYQNYYSHRPSPHTSIREDMEALIKEVIKCNYCSIVLSNPTMSDDDYGKKYAQLVKLEKKYPELARWYTPTKTNGFVENMAIEAFGANEWFTLVRTLNLTKPEVILKQKFPEDKMNLADICQFGEG